VIVVVIIALVILCYASIYVNPWVPWNPFKPATPTVVAVVSATAFVPWTDTPTSTATNTPTPTGTWTPTPTPTTTNTPLPPTDTPTATPTWTNTPAPPPPTSRPRPTATPTPWPYDYESAGARADCARTWVHGYVLGTNGLAEANVQMRVGNNQGWVGDVYTNANGYYEATFQWKAVAGRWFVRVFKGGQPRSMQFWWETSAGCDGPYSLQEVEIIWRHR
jgi:hypothetical protein